jgi:hypothetical protein
MRQYKTSCFLSFSILCVAYCAISCTTSGTVSPAVKKPDSRISPAVSTASDNLNTGLFSGLPPEAQKYLRSISQAFRVSDTEFLLAQGERQFEAEVKKFYDDETYFALLYRIGAYAAESSWEKAEKPHLNFREISRIEYTDWKEDGPMLEIKGQLITVSGEAVPCKLILAWRLTEPKILGRYP